MKWDESKHPRDNDGKFATARYNSMSIDELKREAMSTLPQTIKLPDKIIPRSVGAKWRNEDIRLLDDTIAHFVEGTKLQNKEIIAGKGVRRKIDDIDRLTRDYPGTTSDEWMKVKATASVVLPDGEITTMEVHWYEHATIGKKEFKEKG